jgi:hypothetical protein
MSDTARDAKNSIGKLPANPPADYKDNYLITANGVHWVRMDFCAEQVQFADQEARRQSLAGKICISEQIARSCLETMIEALESYNLKAELTSDPCEKTRYLLNAAALKKNLTS